MPGTQCLDIFHSLIPNHFLDLNLFYPVTLTEHVPTQYVPCSFSSLNMTEVSVLAMQVLSELKGKVLSEVIAEGMGKLASMPSGKTTLYGVAHVYERFLVPCYISRSLCTL